MDALLAKAQELAVIYTPILLKAIAILFFGWIVAKIITAVVRRLLRSARVEPTIVSFTCNLTYMILLVFVVIAAIGKLGVDTTSFAAVVAAAGLAIGFALQGSLGNFAAGVMLLFFRPFKVGDFVEAAGVAGIVQEIQVFATVFNTPDNKRIICPNSAITGDNITNYSFNSTRRVDLVFGIGYADDIDKAKEAIQAILEKEGRVLEDPAFVVAVSELADSSVNFVVRPWVKTEDYWAVFFDLTEAIKKEFDGRGISIPFPQRDVHLHQVA